MKAALPEGVADEHGGRAAGAIFLGQEIAARQWVWMPRAGRNSLDAVAAGTRSGSPAPLMLRPYSGMAKAAAI